MHQNTKRGFPYPCKSATTEKVFQCILDHSPAMRERWREIGGVSGKSVPKRMCFITAFWMQCKELEKSDFSKEIFMICRVLMDELFLNAIFLL